MKRQSGFTLVEIAIVLVIIGLTHLAQRHVQDSYQKELRDKVSTSAQLVLSVINDILDIAKMEGGKVNVELSDFSLARLLDNSLAMAADKARHKGLSLVVQVADDLPEMLRGDRLRLGQILTNLANNAVKFTDSGSVTVRVNRQAESEKGILLRFQIQDTGIGIAPEMRARLFQVFEQADLSSTRRYGGTGLGLAISRQLVELMGGEIGVDSEVGRGSSFWFTARFARGEAMAVELLSQPDTEAEAAYLEKLLAERYRGRRVLLAEDNPMNQEVLGELLRDTGLIVELAENGAEALMLARRQSYDLVLMDVQMPVMDGLEATRALRALRGWAETPILALTANAFDDDRAQCLRAGMNDFLAKPVVPVALFRYLLKWLPQPNATARVEPPVAQAMVSAASDEELRQRLEKVANLNVLLGMQSVRNRMSTYVRLLGKYVDSHGEDMVSVREQLAAGNFDEARRLAHSLKGVSATLGATEIQARALELETVIRDRADAARIDQCIVDVQAAWAPLAAALQQALPPRS